MVIPGCFHDRKQQRPNTKGLFKILNYNPFHYEKLFVEWKLGDATTGIAENTDDQFGEGIIYFGITATSGMNWAFDAYEWW